MLTIVVWNAFSMVTGMICAFVMLTFRNVLGTMLFWMNCVVFVAGVAFVVCCYVLVPILPIDWLAGLFLGACLTIVSGAVGVFVCRTDKVRTAHVRTFARSRVRTFARLHVCARPLRPTCVVRCSS